LAVIEHFWCASYAATLRPRVGRLVLDLHNIESQLAETHAASIHGLARAAQQRFARMYRDLEHEWLPRFDTLLVTSEADRARLVHPDIRVFPNAIPNVALPKLCERPAVVFSGNLEYHPNIEAVRWIARELQPQLAARIPGAEWRLIGRNPHAVEPLLRGRPGITLVGPVDDAIGSIAEARVCAVPLLSGSGTRFKILEAWAAGRAVVSTSIGAEGLGAIHGEHLLIADTASEFVDAIARLWTDQDLRQRLGTAGRALYEQRFTWDAAGRQLDAQGGL
jgi:glycosyltransferase involved in cell wall biosynthesis